MTSSMNEFRWCHWPALTPAAACSPSNFAQNFSSSRKSLIYLFWNAQEQRASNREVAGSNLARVTWLFDSSQWMIQWLECEHHQVGALCALVCAREKSLTKLYSGLCYNVYLYYTRCILFPLFSHYYYFSTSILLLPYCRSFCFRERAAAEADFLLLFLSRREEGGKKLFLCCESLCSCKS